MHYVYLTNSVVTDQCQVDPYSVFSEGYAAGFIEAPDEVTFGWSLVDGGWVAPPASPEQTDDYKREANKLKAIQLLAETDWSDKPSVTDTTKPLHLVNAAEWDAYRDALRVIAVVPPVVVTEWPTKPEEVWSV